MAKQHEILAVEQSKKSAANKIMAEANDQFRKKADRYEGSSRTYSPSTEDGDRLPAENKYLGDEDRVPSKLAYVSEILGPYLDVAATKEATNQVAKADIVVEGDVLLADMPATTLLFLEKELKAYRVLLDAIPTLDPTEKWTWNDNQKYWESEKKETRRTVKITTPLVLYPATEEHPAQVTTTNIEETVGYWEGQKFSGAISVREKADLLRRCDDLIDAVTQARMRANEAEAQEQKIAKKLFDFILVPIAKKA